MMDPLRTIALGAFLLATKAPAMAQQSLPPTDAASAPSAESTSLSRDDREFLRNAAESGLAELQAAQLALQAAPSPDVRQFAQQLVEEHTASNARLAAIAARKGGELPATPGLVEQGRIRQLQLSTGPEFEQQYVESLGVRAHQGTVALFQQHAERGQDPELRRFAQEQLPKLRQDLQLAQQLQARMSAQAVPGTSMGAGGVPDNR
jgi:putative membrane protein